MLPLLLPLIAESLNDSRNSATSRSTFFEPFLGGGALFFALNEQQLSVEKYSLNDLNADLINCYTIVRNRVDDLIEILSSMERDCSEKRYYLVRQSDPQTSLTRAARTIYLNRLCFNGLYRLNRGGQFNVPYGHLKKPKVCNETVLREASRSLQRATLSTSDFAQAVSKSRSGDIIYFDPPYSPLSSTSNFSSYHNSSFGIDEHERLSATISELTSRKVRVILSNSDTRFTRACFKHLNLYSIPARRSISASSSGRISVTELLGTNFAFDHKNSPIPIKKVSLKNTKDLD